MSYDLKIVQEHPAPRYLLVNADGAIYDISEVLYHILCSYRDNEDCHLVAEEMNDRYETSWFDDSFIEESVRSAYAKISERENAGVRQAGRYIRGKITVVKEGRLGNVYKAVSVLFRGAVFAPLLAIALGLTLSFFYVNRLLSPDAIYRASKDSLSLLNGVVLYAAFVLLIFLHEIGHAAASTKFGIKPREIGFGFYWVFPVFYTNVTDIWLLSKGRRIMVNIAGIYMQLLINAVLISLYYMGTGRTVLFPLIIANTLSACTSLIPFFRYDGYWVYSDYWDLPNLQARARSLIASGFRKTMGDKPPALVVYSLLNLLFWVYVYVTLARYALYAVTALVHLNRHS